MHRVIGRAASWEGQAAADVRRGGTVPVPFGRHLPWGQPARLIGDYQRLAGTRQYLAERLHRTPVRVGTRYPQDAFRSVAVIPDCWLIHRRSGQGAVHQGR